jgi:hypothetical protein
MANERLKCATALVAAQALLDAAPELLLLCREDAFEEFFSIVRAAMNSYERIQTQREGARFEPSVN